MNILKIIYKIGKCLATIFLVLVLIVVLVQRVSKNNLAIGGIRIFTVISESMAPVYELGDILVSKKTEPAEIQVGDHVTYLGSAQDLKGLVITHEVIEKRAENGKYYFVTKGTANEIADPEISEDNLYGKVIYKTIIFSFLGGLMTNTMIYYALFIVVGVAVSYQIIRGFIIKDDDDEESIRDAEKTNE